MCDQRKGGPKPAWILKTFLGQNFNFAPTKYERPKTS